MASKTRKGSQTSLIVEEKEECGKCEKKVENEEKAVLCDICKVWFHQTCGNIDEGLYQAITKFGYSGTKELPWQCKTCKRYAAQMITEMIQLKQKQDKLEKKMKDIEKKINVNERDFSELKKTVEVNSDKIDKVGEEMERNASVAQPSVSSELNRETLQKQIKEEVNEIVEREKRKFRIVITNLTQEEDSLGEVQSKVIKLLDTLSVTEESIVQVIQLKDKRFVSVELKNTEIKGEIIRKARRLKNNTQYEDVYIRPDLTYKQRKEGQKLREELKLRTQRGESNLIIRRGQLIKVLETQEGTSSQSLTEKDSAPFRAS